MAEIQTKPTDADVDAFLAEVPQPRRGQAQAVRELMTRVTGVEPVMWGQAALTLYGVYNDYGPVDPLFDGLGPHTTGKGCLYLKSLDDIDQYVLERLVRQAWERASAK